MRSKDEIEKELEFMRQKETEHKGHLCTYTTSEVYGACARMMEWVLNE